MEDKSINVGKVAMTMGGNYDPSKAYDKLVCVHYNSRSWVSRKPVSEGIVPSEANSSFWQMISDRGERGPQGQSYVDKELVPIVDDLTTGGSANVLSAEQGKVLKQELTELESEVNNTYKATTSTSATWIFKDELKSFVGCKKVFIRVIKDSSVSLKLYDGSNEIQALSSNIWQEFDFSAISNPQIFCSGSSVELEITGQFTSNPYYADIDAYIQKQDGKVSSLIGGIRDTTKNAAASGLGRLRIYNQRGEEEVGPSKMCF